MIRTQTYIAQHASRNQDDTFEISRLGLARFRNPTDQYPLVKQLCIVVLLEFDADEIGASPAVTVGILRETSPDEAMTTLQFTTDNGPEQGNEHTMMTTIVGTPAGVDDRWIGWGMGRMVLTWNVPALSLPGPGVYMAATQVNGEQSSHAAFFVE